MMDKGGLRVDKGIPFASSDILRAVKAGEAE